jgi:ribose transport system substrate-binding protein
VLDSNQYGGDLGKARKTADAMLLAHPDIDGVFCPNESTTHGMLGALQAIGKAGVVRFVGFDANAPLVQGLTDGQIDGLVLQDPVGMGKAGVEAMVAHLRGQKVEPEQHTALQLATKANMQTPDVARVLHPDLSILGK